MKLKITALVLSVLALSALCLTACKGKQLPDDENFIYTEISEGDKVVAYEIAGISNYDRCPSDISLPASYKGKPVKSIADEAFYEESHIKSVTIPDSIGSIGESAFWACENLEQVTAGNGLTTLGELAFADCVKLEKVSLGNNVKTIEGYAFSQCTALKTINFPSSLESIGECAFVACAKLESVKFYDGLKSIGDAAFAGCSNLQSFIMPDSVTSIGFGVLMFQTGGAGFEGAVSITNRLTELVISVNISEIPDFAFSKCNISSVEIGKSVKTIRYSSFYGCALLESVVIPKTVTEIESYAFYNCSSLRSVYYGGTEAEWNKITIGKNGNDISTAPKYYYSETQPAAGGNYWHYVNNKPTKW